MAKPSGTPCPQCRHINALGRMFCTECGAKLDMMAGDLSRARPRREINLGIWISRLFRLALLCALVGVLALLLWPQPPEGAEGTAEDALHFYRKVTRMEQGIQRGALADAIFSEAEINSYLQEIGRKTVEAAKGGAGLNMAASLLRIRLPEGRVVFYAHAPLGPATLSYRIEGVPEFDGRDFQFKVERAHLGRLPMPGDRATQWLARRVSIVFSQMDRERKVLDGVHRWESRDGAVKLIHDARPAAPLPPPAPRQFR